MILAERKPSEAMEIKKELPLYVAGGQPSEDTLKHYNTEIDNFLFWCEINSYNVLDFTEKAAFHYMHYLTEQGYSQQSINLKISAARTFYFVASKLNVVSSNPFADVKPKKATTDDADFSFFTMEEIKTMIGYVVARDYISDERDLAIIMLMSVEGLRTVEVHRMSDSDIDWKNNRILIHGKGRDSYIYPCEDSLNILKKYIDNRPQPTRDEEGVPTFIGYSKKFFGQRISRNGIRFAINEILKAVGLKKSGDSCHVLRHSCGTNLYKATKDLRLVQETLRHADPNTTARYTHVMDKLEDRETKKISPFS